MNSNSAQIIRIENNQLLNDTAKWQGNIELNFNSVKNNNAFFQLSTGSQIKYHVGSNAFISINGLRLIFAGSNRLDNRGFQHLRYQRSLNEFFTLESFAQIQFDQVLLIKLRQLMGIGPRMHLFRKRKNHIYLGTQYMYEYEEERTTDIINRTHRLSSYLTYARSLKKIQFHLISYYQPNFVDFSDYRVSGSLNCAIKIYKQLLFSIRGELAYDSMPVSGVTNMNYTLVNGFSYKF